MRVTHEINLLNSAPEGQQHLLQGRYRVYWTRLPGNNLKSFGVVDATGVLGPLGNAVLLDAEQSDGLARCVRVAMAANALHATATALGFQLEGLAELSPAQAKADAKYASAHLDVQRTGGRCEAQLGPGLMHTQGSTCGRLLDDRGQCDRASDHAEGWTGS